MKNIFKLLAIILIIGATIACSEDNSNVSIIPITEFVLPEDCSWKNDMQQEKLFRVDNLEDLKDLSFIDCDKELTVDFQTKTLLFVYIVTGPIKDISYRLLVTDKSTSSYDFEVTIHQKKGNVESIGVPHRIAVLVDKIEKSSSIRLRVL